LIELLAKLEEQNDFTFPIFAEHLAKLLFNLAASEKNNSMEDWHFTEI